MKDIMRSSPSVPSSWSELPSDLLLSILKEYVRGNHFDMRRARVVCRSWRSRIPRPLQAPSPPLPMEISFLSGEAHMLMMTDFVISKTMIYCLEPPIGSSSPSSNRSWLVKVRKPSSEGKLHVINPFSIQPIVDLPKSFPKVMNCLNFQVKEMSSCINLHRPNYDPNYSLFDSETRIHKVVVSSLPCSDIDELVFLAIKGPDLCVMQITDEEWTLLDNKVAYRDIASFNGIFFAADMYGRVLTIDQSDCAMAYVKEDKHSLGVPKGEMYFVESCGDLFLVARDLEICEDVVYYDDEEDCYFREAGAGYVPAKFNIYKLIEYNPNHENGGGDDQEGRATTGRRFKFEEVDDLGDRVFVLSKDHSFSFGSGDFLGCKSNCIYFFANDVKRPPDDYYSEDEDEDGEILGDWSICVCNFENGHSGPMASMPGYPNLFWPPPSWLAGSGNVPTSSFFTRQGVETNGH